MFNESQRGSLILEESDNKHLHMSMQQMQQVLHRTQHYDDCHKILQTLDL